MKKSMDAVTNPKVHLVTVVGSHLEILPHMLTHYRNLGVDSITVSIHLNAYDDLLYTRARRVCEEYSADILSVYAGKWLECVNQFLYHEARHEHPTDWFILADVDELHVYPSEIHELFGSVASEGYNYIEGCVIDRVARDGTLPNVISGVPIWDQFPLGGLITSTLLGAEIRKVVAVRGLVPLTPGQHFALSGNGCPIERLYVPVFHFKWFAGLAERLEKRVRFYQDNQDGIWQESQRFIDYYYGHGQRIDVIDPRFCIADCSNGYPQWDALKEIMLASAGKTVGAGTRTRSDQ